MRPLTRPSGSSWTTIFPMRKRASSTVSVGSSERRRRRTESFTVDFFKASPVGDIGGQSAGLQLLQVAGRHKILILRMLTNETADVGTERHNSQVIGASEIERHSD